MLFPKKVKHRKAQVKRSNPKKKTVATRGTALAFGFAALKASQEGRITSRQIEAARRTLSRSLGKTGRVWIRIYPDQPYTKKPPEVKMGKGKGDLEGYYAQVKPGQIIFEADGASATEAEASLQKAGKKLPIRTRVVIR